MYWPITSSLLHHGTLYAWTPRDIPGPPEGVPVVVPAAAGLLIREAVSSLLAQLGDDFVIPPHKSSTLPSPAPKIDQIDDEIRQLRSAMLAVTHEFGQRITSLSKRRNSLVTFGKLPLELSGLILRHSLDVPAGNYEYKWGSIRVRRLRELACVSSGWLYAVRCCPTLWTTIDIGDRNLSNIALKLRKSGALPLNISGAWEDDFPSENIDAVMAHCHRWVSVNIQLNRDLLSRISRRLETPMPLLESLTLMVGWGRRGVETIRITGSNSFHTLELTGVMAHQDSPVLKTVRKLQIRSSGASNVLAVLPSTTRLESLSLDGIKESDLAAHTGAGMPPVQLPRLRSLELTGMKPLAVIGLMDTIRWEGLTVLRIIPDGWDSSDQLLSQLMDNRRSILTSIITLHMKTIKLHIRNDTMLEITGGSGESRRADISLQLWGVSQCFSTAESFRGFASHLPEVEVVLTDDSAPAVSARAPWNMAFLFEMPSVVSMVIESRERLIREVFTNILGKPHRACPRLTTVRISNVGLQKKDWEALCPLMEDALRARKKANPTLPTIVVDAEREVPSGGRTIRID